MGFALPQNGFRSEQKKYGRVRTAYADKEQKVTSLLTKAGLKMESFELYIRAFKKEEVVQLWGRHKFRGGYKLIAEYPFCASSGTLGPKRKQGDMQIPEGFYYIDRFNAWSNFFLSLGIDYPNASDKKLGDANAGGDIFIHGDCVTIGCIPITDDKIKEVYVLAIEAKNGGQAKIPVHIFPAKMDADGVQRLILEYKHDKDLVTFWENLKPAYEYFEEKRVLPNISIAPNGRYFFFQ